MKSRVEAGTTSHPSPDRMVHQILGLLHDQPGGAAFRPEMPKGTSPVVEVYTYNTDDNTHVGVRTFTLPFISFTGRRPVGGVEFIVTGNGISTAEVRGSKKLSLRGEISDRTPRRVSAPIDEAALPDVLSRYAVPLDAVAEQVALGRNITVDNYGITGEAQQEAEDVARIHGEAQRLLELSTGTTISTVSLLEGEGVGMATGQTTPPVRFVSDEHGDLVVYRKPGFLGSSIGITIQPPQQEPMLYKVKRGDVEQLERESRNWQRSSRRDKHDLAETLHAYDAKNLIAA